MSARALASLLLVAALGCGPAAAPPPLTGDRLRTPELRAPDALIVRWVGPCRGRILVDFPGTTRPALALDAASGERLSQELRGATLRLDPPLVAPSTVRLSPLDAAGAPAGSPTTSVLDPAPLLEKALGPLLAPLDELDGPRLLALLQDVQGVASPSATGLGLPPPPAALLRARRDLAARLARHGLSARFTWRLREALPGLLAGSDGAGAASLARRLQPLRYLEEIIEDRLRLEAPWGNVGRASGVRFAWGRPSAEAPEGWSPLGRASFEREVADPAGGGVRRMRLTWIADEAFVRDASTVGGMLSGMTATIDTVLRASTFVAERPTMAGLKTSLAVPLEVRVPSGRSWPPAELAVDLTVRAFSKALALRVGPRGAPGALVLQTATAELPAPDLALFDELTVSARVDPARLGPGRQELELRAECVPGERVVCPLGVAVVALRGRW